MDPIEEFERRRKAMEQASHQDSAFRALSRNWFSAANSYEYSYRFDWLSRPIIQYPQDIIALQELFWRIKPDLVIETGIAHGGSLILSASMLALLDYCDSVEQKNTLNPLASGRRVIGVDVDIRPHNRAAIVSHPLSHLVHMIEGSSTSDDVLDQVCRIASNHNRVLVILDSNHTHEHVLAELQAYAPLVSVGSYCVVFDTVIEDLPPDSFPDRPWDIGNNPKTAVREYLRQDDRFEVDPDIEAKIQITVAPDGYLRRVR